jgi:hypothetical protein
MGAPRILTFEDAYDRLESWIRFYSEKSADANMIRRCIMEAYDEVANAHSWTFLKQTTRIQLKAPQTTGTATYDHTGGTYERMLTLSGATWPTDVVDYDIRIDDIVCHIDERKSSTIVTLAADMCPPADLTGETYSLFPRWYLLPSDFEAMANTLEETYRWTLGDYVSLEEIAELLRTDSTTGDIRYYSIGAAEGIYGNLALYVWPPSGTTETLDFVYRRRPRELRHSGKASNDYVGNITVTGNSATITGASTAFSETMEGAIIRLSSTSTRPTDFSGSNPRVEERAIASYTSATLATADAVFSANRSSVGYTISDPIDLHVSVHETFLRCCEKHAANALRMYPNEKMAAMQAYEDALAKAKGMDGGRVRQRRVCGMPPSRQMRLSDSTTSRDNA